MVSKVRVRGQRVPDRLVREGSLTGRPLSRERALPQHVCSDRRSREHTRPKAGVFPSWPRKSTEVSADRAERARGARSETRLERQQVGPRGPGRPGQASGFYSE